LRKVTAFDSDIVRRRAIAHPLSPFTLVRR